MSGRCAWRRRASFWTIRELEPQDQERAISAMLQLPNDIGLPDTRQLVPLMVEIAGATLS